MTHPSTGDMAINTSLLDVSVNTELDTNLSISDPSFLNPSSGQSGSKQLAPPSTMDASDQMQEITTRSEPLNQSPQPKNSTPIQHLPTRETYNAWASVYDTDGNILQAIDDLSLSTLLPEFLTQVLSSSSSSTLNILDLGCGTGRNTAKLLTYPWPTDKLVNVHGVDFSRKMLDIAERKLRGAKEQWSPSIHKLGLECTDAFNDDSGNEVFFPALQLHAIISTLVAEHIPLETYFRALAELLPREGSCALITNMHQEMGQLSQAGFVTSEGVKIRGTSYVHSVEDMMEEAMRWGFEVLGVNERRVEKGDLGKGGIGKRGEKWVKLGVNVWFGIVLKRIGSGGKEGGGGGMK
ncbi:S-adenosyl-L-methionine-dependent methyltransferase [Delitschia confertaspora ATCC 74209]|uniref:S-adenosyl-L-methionine-dependent methyltransferase n=1 Tax=Delitschia confertaspora ATCC 74209 TaxID=1513339 RepID=A0A9P4JUH7_9PLEO|nr:S-adenosyl-L-methionine-dependent methyltransferase [Delitschia confertaspora ATCC 74209]